MAPETILSGPGNGTSGTPPVKVPHTPAFSAGLSVCTLSGPLHSLFALSVKPARDLL